MRYASAVSEAVRNLLSGTTRALILALALGLGVGGLMAFDLLTIGGLQRQAIAFDRSGASTRVLTAEHLVSGADCERVADLPGVRGSGALRPARPVTLAASPDDPIPSYAVSPGLARVLGVRGGEAGVWLPTSLARMLGVEPGEVMATKQGELQIAGTFDYPEDGRDARLGFALLVPEPSSATFDECWAAAWPGASGLDDALRWASVVQPGSSTPLTIGQLNNGHGPPYDARAQFDARVPRWGWLGALVLGLAVGYVASRRRRLEYASALHAGESRPAQLLTALVEATVWIGLALCLAISAGMVVAARSVPEQTGVVLLAQVPTLVAGGLAAVTGVLVGVLQTKERHLFGYFKDR